MGTKQKERRQGKCVVEYADKADGHDHLCSWIKFSAQLFLDLSLVAVKCCAKAFYKSKGEELRNLKPSDINTQDDTRNSTCINS